jgi:acyl-CoA reductase-like NAD-dependent aldehyde dehydrogenase
LVKIVSVLITSYDFQVPWSLGQLFVHESIWENFVSRLRERVGRLRVGDAFDHLADVGSPLTKDIIADLTGATSLAQKNGLEVPVEKYECDILYL